MSPPPVEPEIEPATSDEGGPSDVGDEAVIEAETAAHAALKVSTRLPPWPLFGDANELAEARRETALRRGGGSDSQRT